MQKTELYKELLSNFASGGEITDAEKYILYEKGKELGFTEQSIKIMVELELSSGNSNSNINLNKSHDFINSKVYKFKSAITRFGPILTPHIIEIIGNNLIYKKRNKYLINIDVTIIPIAKVASVKIDTSILGTDIIIESSGSDKIIATNFTKSDAKKIQMIIKNIQRKL